MSVGLSSAPSLLALYDLQLEAGCVVSPLNFGYGVMSLNLE
jgi:hypothetical protein